MAPPARAQQLTFAPADIPAFPGARAIASADFDGNGWIDLAQANNGRHTVTILLNSDAGWTRTFDLPLGAGAGPFDLVATDFNGDHVPDLGVANADNNTIGILLGKRSGGFAAVRTIAAPGNPRGIAAADMDRDGITDIVYSAFQLNAVQVLLGNGDGSFTAGGVVTSLGTQPQGLALGDFDRDGSVDAAVAHAGAGGLAVVSGNGAGGFSGLMFSLTALSGVNVVTTADFDHNGWTDFAVASTGASRVAFYAVDRSGVDHVGTWMTGPSPRGIAAADFNIDGLLDVATANRSASTVTVLLGSSEGGFEPPFHVPTGSGGRTLTVADFNNDARPDIATGNELATAASLLTNDMRVPWAAFAFEQRAAYPTTDSSTALAAADFDRNGALDVLVSGRVIFDDGMEVPLAASGHRAYAVADFNRDGRSDIVGLTEYTARLEVFTSTGSRTFAPVWTEPFTGYQVDVLHMDRDGIPDLAVSGFSDGHVVVRTYLGTGDGSFHFAAEQIIGTTPVITLADLNRDGWLDVVTTQSTLSGSSALVLPGTGRGGFGALQAIPLDGLYVNVVAAADFNHDGLADLAYTAYDEDFELAGAVKLASAPGVFSPARRFSLTGAAEHYVNPFTLSVADINADGHLDLVFESLLLGRGDGSFVPSRFALPWATRVFSDFDQDGLVDLLATDGEAARLMINVRERDNQPPALRLLRDVTFSYVGLQEEEYEENCGLCADASDADHHALTFAWRDTSGMLVGFGPTLLPRMLPSGVHELTLSVTDNRGGEATDSMTVTILPFEEIVTDGATDCCGAWRFVEDAAAGDGAVMHHPDAGAPKLAAPLADPVDYFDVEFTADPTQEYKLWIRLKAAANSVYNDSVILQFSGAVDRAGAAVYRIGTASGLHVNLEQCSGCGLSGWGWRDERWGPSLNATPVLLRFPAGGRQRLRIQAREDGVSVDQIVLSADQYRTRAPGSAKGDGTVLGRTTY
jgi:hypothetical protein